MWRRWVFRIGMIALALGAALYGLNAFSKAKCTQLTGELTCRVETREKLVPLSFDDGPTPEGVAAVLPILAEYDAKATFFLIGKDMERHPQEAGRILEAGHELGNHSFSHQRNIGYSRAFYRSELEQTEALLAAAGSDSGLFRPPFGRKLLGLPLEARDAGLHTIMWDVEDQPERFTDPAAYAEDILDRVRPGSIILIHPMYRHNQAAREALPAILSGLRTRGYEIVTVGELLERTGSRGGPAQ
ncbi:polysaccharide deacetylase family protein [Parerythrobacter lacustris]|uniref:Chitooligosaccharide deacetylase n=1 Tax=Parerythrobacter lacustris TaxID=2969984 RepID=A0ABT1XT37_9SPHN|nr:polysaccharide deacetylase family protein [Parerythrobacter lacustris]MCR2834786.1 polysaccharide deacetylase family protein [Parerythrobacter lacustris]